MEGYEGCLGGGKKKALKMLYGLHLNIFRHERVSSLIPKADASKPESLFQCPTYICEELHM